jgi:hypothetical protein
MTPLNADELLAQRAGTVKRRDLNALVGDERPERGRPRTLRDIDRELALAGTRRALAQALEDDYTRECKALIRERDEHDPAGSRSRVARLAGLSRGTVHEILPPRTTKHHQEV